MRHGGEKNTNLIINKPLSIASAMGRGLGWGKSPSMARAFCALGEGFREG